MLMTVPANVAAAITNEFPKITDNCFKVLSQIFFTISGTSKLYYNFILPQVTQRFSL
jgi:hypothetical protein